MERNVVLYQDAFNSVIQKLEANDAVLGVMVFGSMVTGDLWEESDIDLILILDKYSNLMKDIYVSEHEVPFHIKLIGKNKFIEIYGRNSRGDFNHRIFASSRLVFSKDQKITSVYDNGKYYPDMDRERWNLVYLGEFIKDIGVCKKYIKNNDIYTAYYSALKSADHFSKLFLNYSGRVVSKNSIAIAVDMDSELKSCIDKLFFHDEKLCSAVNNFTIYAGSIVDRNLKSICEILIDYLRNKKNPVSSYEISTDSLFKDFEINFEEIFERLTIKKIIKQTERDIKTSKDNVLIKEKVYFI